MPTLSGLVNMLAPLVYGVETLEALVASVPLSAVRVRQQKMSLQGGPIHKAFATNGTGARQVVRRQMLPEPTDAYKFRITDTAHSAVTM